MAPAEREESPPPPPLIVTLLVFWLLLSSETQTTTPALVVSGVAPGRLTIPVLRAGVVMVAPGLAAVGAGGLDSSFVWRSPLESTAQSFISETGAVHVYPDWQQA
ncbi:hypothetical protein B0T14DRAFT_523025 [Immersiella caudata]|uniref:Uncharacterized protein n=1 Tax=Immersiella caudata TaxID=314043 RepID=A0AA39WJ81_9PEZI|nr:hypothetical protein B0T14DRAFT_523025 [Immersiella caudata]